MSRLTNPNLDRTLSEKAYDFLGELILEIETKELLQELEREQADGSAAEMNAFFVKQDKRNLESIRKYFHKQHYKHLFSKTLPKVAQIAAIVIAVITLLGSVAIATSHTVRIHVMKLLQNMEEEYTVVKMVEDESASFDVPAEWMGTSFMSYVPENLEISNVFSMPDNHFVEYRNVDTGATSLKFSEYGVGSWVQIDTQNANTEEITSENCTYFMAEKGGNYTVYWCDGKNIFSIFLQRGSREEVLRIADGVKKIN